MMIEPTESESKETLDRYCDALIQIRSEIADIESGKADKEDNMLKNAPHTLDMLMQPDWSHPYVLWPTPVVAWNLGASCLGTALLGTGSRL